jgi:hypothetical protein
MCIQCLPRPQLVEWINLLKVAQDYLELETKHRLLLTNQARLSAMLLLAGLLPVKGILN